MVMSLWYVELYTTNKATKIGILYVVHYIFSCSSTVETMHGYVKGHNIPVV
jgi:hypothetical protein